MLQHATCYNYSRILDMLEYLRQRSMESFTNIVIQKLQFKMWRFPQVASQHIAIEKCFYCKTLQWQFKILQLRFIPRLLFDTKSLKLQ